MRCTQRTGSGRIRLPLLSALLFLLVGAVGVAQAAPANLNAGPVSVRGYKMTMFTSGSSLGISFVRSTSTGSQQHMYSFRLGPGAFKANASLTAVTLKTGKLGSFGSVSMRLVGAGKLTKRKTCGVTARGRSGKLSGSFKLVLDKTYFKTVSLKLLPATVSRSSGKFNCGTGNQPPSKTAGTLTLSAVSSGTGPMFIATKSAKGVVSEFVTMTEQQAPASITHTIVAKGSASALTAAPDLSTGHAAGIAPLFSGALDFAAQAPGTQAGSCTNAFGELTGSIVAHFNSVGDQTVGAGQGLLTRC